MSKGVFQQDVSSDLDSSLKISGDMTHRLELRPSQGKGFITRSSSTPFPPVDVTIHFCPRSTGITTKSWENPRCSLLKEVLPISSRPRTPSLVPASPVLLLGETGGPLYRSHVPRGTVGVVGTLGRVTAPEHKDWFEDLDQGRPWGRYYSRGFRREVLGSSGRRAPFSGCRRPLCSRSSVP